MALELQKFLQLEHGFPTASYAAVVLRFLRNLGCDESGYYTQELRMDALGQNITAEEPVDDETASEILKYIK